MKRNNKKGISAIVATVLIIAITVGVVAIVGRFTIDLVTNSLTEGPLCSKAAQNILVQTGKGLTCYDSTTGKMEIQVSHGAESVELGGLMVYFSIDGSDYNSTEVNTSKLSPGLTRVLITDMPKEDGVEADSFAMAPIVGDGRIVCDKSGYVNVIPCN